MKKVLLAVLCLISVGCSQSVTPPAAPSAQVLKHQIQIISEDENLRRNMQVRLNAEPGVVPVLDDGLSPLRLLMQVEPYERSATSKAPQLFGRLTPAPESSNIVVSFALASIGGNVLERGEVVGVGRPQLKLYPGGTLAPDELAYQDVIGQIIDRINPHLKVRNWRTPVVATVDTSHVLIAAGRESGLKVRSLLQTEALPLSVLEVTTFEAMPSGTERTVLRLLEGPLPQVGKTLIPKN